MRNIKLTSEEKKIEDAFFNGKFQKVKKSEYDEIVKAINSRKKDAVLNIRINKQDLMNIKKKAKQMGVKYQTFISEFLHSLAES